MSLALVASLLGSSCFEGEEGERFYGRVVVPRAQEFRWSDGGLPRVFDPARAAAPPDTDAVRALFEGLTDYEPGTLRPIPAVASRWESAEGGRLWTFHLRRDARWSNGDDVTARDFVRSWQRTLRLGDTAPHARLLANIVGARAQAAYVTPGARGEEGAADQSARGETAEARPTPQPFGAEALDAHTLRVKLQRPDINFPALVAHPVFRPLHELSPVTDLNALQAERQQGERGESAGQGMVTNGAFRLAAFGGATVTLERAQHYWDAPSVKLERVHFVDAGDAEEALAAYRKGEVDAVTNAPFEPLAVKLLTPYKDFRRETFGALNYYRFNTARPPFDDRRVREALALALDLERLSNDTLDGATRPATKFLPFESGAPTAAGEATEGASAETESARETVGDERTGGPGADDEKAAGEAKAGSVSTGAEGGESLQPVRHNVARARALLAEAGYPDGENFPRVRLLINRNEQQRLVAEAVKRMWREALGVETDINAPQSWEEYEAMLRAGNYDVARRSIVMQTLDEETNMLALFGEDAAADESETESPGRASPTPGDSPAEATNDVAAKEPAAPSTRAPVLSEAQALRELPAIPLYFASSYALVKPYVSGFESNLLDAPSLKHVRLDTAWQPPEKPQAIRVVRRVSR